MFGIFTRWRRRAIRERPFPPSWKAILDRNVAHAALLDDEERAELEALVAIFLEEKHFEGCGGLELDDEIRVTIAAQACILILRLDTDIYPELVTILVYPSAYRAPTTRAAGGVVIETEDARLGESWTRGVLVVAWDRAKSEARTMGTSNVVLHEFAHQLDSEGGSMDGAPDLGATSRYRSWARVLGEEYEALCQKLHSGKPTDLDPYGATSPPEFFAVVTEMFFERPVALRRSHPELYAELARFFAQDPAARMESARRG